MSFKTHLSQNQILNLKTPKNYKVAIKREDRIHHYISGNKYRKLKYNLQKAQEEGKKTLLTFGGAFSNHILAVAAAGKEMGFETIGIIRGEELLNCIDENPTLQLAQHFGMQFQFVTRENFRNKTSPQFIDKLTAAYGDFYLIPEGGTNGLAIKGCEEILTEDDFDYDFICCAVGTGGTIAGLINAALPHQKFLGFPALKGDFLQEEISRFARNLNWQLIMDYHFGGYGKINSELVGFINEFKENYHIPLDPVYTGKMMYGVMDLLNRGCFPENSKILVIHTGGLQGIAGMNALLKKKKLPLIS